MIFLCQNNSNLRGLLMVGNMALNHGILVRFQAPQPSKNQTFKYFLTATQLEKTPKTTPAAVWISKI